MNRAIADLDVPPRTGLSLRFLLVAGALIVLALGGLIAKRGGVWTTASAPIPGGTLLALRGTQLAIENETHAMDLERARRLAPLIAARTAAAAAHGQASGDDLACFGPDITAQTVLDACGARAWWLEGGQIKHQVVTAPAAPKAGP